MKALVKSHAKEGIWLEDVPEPEIGNNDILINRDDLNSSPIPSSTQPRTGNQYDKYYKKNNKKLKKE